VNEAIPELPDNPATLATEPLQLFEMDASGEVAERPARARPADRPRIAPPADAPSTNVFVVFEFKAEAPPCETKAQPRPKGRERNGTTEAGREPTSDKS